MTTEEKSLMMSEFQWIQTSVFLIALLQFPASAQIQPLYFAVRGGDDVTLPCEHVIDGRQNCDSILWLFSDLRNTAAVELVKQGQIGENAGAKSDRLTSDCSLVMKKVKQEDVGGYFCRQHGRDTLIYLSVVTITEQKDTHNVKLHCTVRTPGDCTYTVKWLFEGRDVHEHNQNVQTSQSDSHCYATAYILNPDIRASSYNVLKCEVKDRFNGKMKSFAFNSQSTDGSFKELTNPASAVNVPSTEHHGAAAETKTLLLAVRVGGEVTLLCENETKDHENCTSTRWLFSRSERTGAQVMFESGTIYGDPGASSGRLSVTENCSLVIQKVTDEDAGRYTCGQNKSGEHSGVDLSVVSMTEQKYADNVTLRCSVSTYEPFSPRVKWLYDSKEVDRQDTTESQSTSTASVTFEKLNNMYISRYNSVQCEVTVNNKVQLFPFRLPSGEDTKSTMKPPPATRTEVMSTTESSRTAAWWRFIAVSVGLSALIITVVTVNIWTQTKGRKTRRDENMVGDDHDGDDTVNYENIRPSAEN